VAVTRHGVKAMEASDADFQEIYAAFQSKILRYMARMVGENEAEDLTQEVFIKIGSALGTFRGDASLSTWIYRIATNTALDKLRNPSFQRTTLNSPDQQSSSPEPEIADKNVWTGEKTPLVEHQIFRKEMNDCIQGFIENLPEDYRTVLILNEFEGLKNKEIAEILEISLAAVKIRLHRARERLKNELRENCDSYWVENNEFLPELKKL
jgi:RNA polymerase sigma-70 factor (ECF subfamily)